MGLFEHSLMKQIAKKKFSKSFMSHFIPQRAVAVIEIDDWGYISNDILKFSFIKTQRFCNWPLMQDYINNLSKVS